MLFFYASDNKNPTPKFIFFPKSKILSVFTNESETATYRETAQNPRLRFQSIQRGSDTGRIVPEFLDMKLVWSPETASKAYIDTVQSCDLHQESGVAELISAMAAGWNAQFIVETWSSGGAIATSIGLAVARRHAGGRHVCVVPDERSRGEYSRAMERAGSAPEVIVGEAEEVMGGLVGIDFLVVDSQRRNFSRVLKLANLSSRGAVLICKNANSRSDSSFRWKNVTDNGTRRLVRSAFLPVGKGLDIAHVAAAGGNSGSGEGKGKWIKHVDRRSGEEFVIRK